MNLNIFIYRLEFWQWAGIERFFKWNHMQRICYVCLCGLVILIMFISNRINDEWLKNNGMRILVHIFRKQIESCCVAQQKAIQVVVVVVVLS